MLNVGQHYASRAVSSKSLVGDHPDGSGFEQYVTFRLPASFGTVALVCLVDMFKSGPPSARAPISAEG